jgi:cysteinyl-tRNA synthetase
MCTAVGLTINEVGDLDPEILDKARRLDAARAAKDFAAADALRDELQDAGYVVETTKEGTRVRSR